MSVWEHGDLTSVTTQIPENIDRKILGKIRVNGKVAYSQQIL